jgi:hypothetical protein
LIQVLLPQAEDNNKEVEDRWEESTTHKHNSRNIATKLELTNYSKMFFSLKLQI